MSEYILLGMVVVFITVFLFLTRKNIINWLIWGTVEAEEYFGSGTGRLKLLYVYNLFTKKYAFISKLIPFSLFSSWVDLALQELRLMLENPKIKEIIFGEQSE